MPTRDIHAMTGTAQPIQIHEAANNQTVVSEVGSQLRPVSKATGLIYANSARFPLPFGLSDGANTAPTANSEVRVDPPPGVLIRRSHQFGIGSKGKATQLSQHCWLQWPRPDNLSSQKLDRFAERQQD